MLLAAKRRAQDNGLEFNIDITDIKIPLFCPIFKWIRLEKTRGRAGPSSPSLDRINNDKGYIKGNVRVISWRANESKGDRKPKELIALALDAVLQEETHDQQ